MPELLFCMEVGEEASGGVFQGAFSASCLSFTDHFFLILISDFPLPLA